MKATLTRRSIEAMEARFGVPMDYARHMLRVAPGALHRLALLLPIARYRKAAPPHVLHFVRLGVTLAEDCGPCAQISVNEALRDGVEPAWLREALEGRLAELPEELGEALRFGRAVVNADPELDALRDALRTRYGDEGVVELALAAATTQLYPLLKRGMGFARSDAAFGLTVDPARAPRAATVA